MKFSFTNLLTVSIICLCTWLVTPLYGQTTRLNDKVSLTVNNVSVSDALEALSKVTGTYFSYNSDQLPANKVVRVDLQNRPMIEVLNAILGQSEFSFRQMGNQVVIFRNKVPAHEPVETPTNSPAVNDKENPKQPVTNSQQQSSKPTPAKPDTVYIVRQYRDTLRFTDTIVRTDTIIEKISTPIGAKEIFRIELSKELTPELKFDIGVTTGVFIPHVNYTATDSFSEKVEQYKKSYSNKSFSGIAGIDIRASYSKWTLSTGLGLSLFSQKLDYSYVEQTGGFYRQDTLDKYYTLNNADTSWYYILDSTYIPIDNKLYNYRINNHFRYLEVPLTIQYNMGFNSMLFFIKAGIITGFYLGSDGHQIIPEGNGITEVEDIEARNMIMSYTAGCGLAVPLTRKFTLTGSLSYRNHLNSIYKDFPVNTRFAAVSIGVGVYYKLY